MNGRTLVGIATCAALLLLENAAAAEWYAAPDGKEDAAGTRDEPWNLGSVLQGKQNVQPGDTIYLAGGTYPGHFESYLKGAKGKPIIVRPVPGEQPRIDSGDTKGEGLHVKGSYVWYIGLEIISTAATDRSTDKRGSWNHLHRGSGLTIGNKAARANPPDGVKLINMVVHDTTNGLGVWRYTGDVEVHGCLVYHNGWDAPDRGHGHGTYTQNKDGFKTFKNNIYFGGYRYGLTNHGTANAFTCNYLIEGNTFFNSGALSKISWAGHLNVGSGDNRSENILVQNNCIYRPADAVDYYGFRLGVFANLEKAPKVSVIVRNNYFTGMSQITNCWEKLTFRNNTLISNNRQNMLNMRVDQTTDKHKQGHNWDANTYYQPKDGLSLARVTTKKNGRSRNVSMSFENWQKYSGYDATTKYIQALPDQEVVFIRPNQYEPGRANITIYNWPGKATVDVDVSDVLKKGDRYVLMDSENFFGKPVLEGVYDGRPLAVRTDQSEAVQPLGKLVKPYTHTPVEFGAFILRRQDAAALYLKK